MTSFTARLSSALLRTTVKPMWSRNRDLDTIRKRQSFLDRMLGGDAEGVKGRNTRLNGRDCMLLEPTNGTRSGRKLLYFHGGAFIIHLPGIYRKFVGRLAAQLGATALVPDYRLAPEHPFPAGFDDCLDAYREMVASGMDMSKLIVGGDSAGGQLTLAVLMAARDEGLPMPACAFVFSPAAGLNKPMASEEHNAHVDPLFTPDALDWFKSLLLPEEYDREDPRISPLCGSTIGLPPLRFDVGSTEMLRDHTTEMARKIWAEGGVAEVRVWHEMPHVFQVLSYLPETKKSLEDVAAFVDRHVTA